MKKFIFILSIMFCICGVCFASTENINVLLNRRVKVLYDNKVQQFKNVSGVKVYPITYDGTTYLPIRAISSLFNKSIRWESATNTIYIGEGSLDITSAQEAKTFVEEQNEGINVLLNRDVKILYNGVVQVFKNANGKVVYPLTYNGTTYLPVRAISNLFGSTIEWNAQSNAVLINKKITINVTSIKLNKNSVELKVGETYSLSVNISPNNATNKQVIWKSSDTSIVSVSNGKITALKAGKAIVTASTVEGNKKSNCMVIVRDVATPTPTPTPTPAPTPTPTPTPTPSNRNIPVIGVLLNKTSCRLVEGTSETLTAIVMPNDATNKNVTWSSSNTSVASINNGKIIANKEGTTTITCRTTDGNKAANCVVTVLPSTIEVTGISLNKKATKLTVGKTESLIATIVPSNATNKTVTWNSSNGAIAGVSNGVITANKVGTAVITARTTNGKMVTCLVSVESVSPTKITLDNTTISLKVSDTKVIKATIAPSNATGKITWTSSNVNITKVDSTGKITAVNAGTATIMGTTVNGLIARCTVNVSKNIVATKDKLEIHFIDTKIANDAVDATYIKIGDKSIFIDGGFKSTGKKAMEYLDKIGVKKIDYYIGSHSHKDHVEAAPQIISKYDVDTVLVGREKCKGSGGEFAAWYAIKIFAKEQKVLDRVKKCKVSAFKVGSTIDINGLKITCLGPISVNNNLERGDVKQNYNSNILRFEYDNTSFIMAGDNSSPSVFKGVAQKYPNLLKADVYKNSHHYGDNRGIYEIVSPKYVVFPTGSASKIQPSSACLSRVKKAGASKYFITSSNKDGTVVFISDGNSITVKTKQ